MILLWPVSYISGLDERKEKKFRGCYLGKSSGLKWRSRLLSVGTNGTAF